MNQGRQCLLSVVTICYNAKDYIAETFESVRQQKQQLFEYIVIDGGSNDGTQEIIKKNQGIIDYWCSESDKGISDALNKGVLKSNGQYIVFLHADDYFVDPFSTERALLKILKGKDIIAFDIFFEKEEKRYLGRSRGFNSYTNCKMPFYHPGVLCKRTLFDKIGLFDTDFKIAMDYDFFLRAYNTGASFSIEKEVITVFRDTGISSRSDWASLSERFSEEKKAHYKNSATYFKRAFYFVWWVVYPFYRRVKYLFEAENERNS